MKSILKQGIECMPAPLPILTEESLRYVRYPHLRSRWRLFRRTSDATSCELDDAACRRANGAARRWFWVVALLALVPLAAPLVAPWFY